jgi:hypothetical protein
MHWHRETQDAICVSENGDTKEAVWLPKSMVVEYSREPDGSVVVVLEEWFAKKKGLV